MTGELKWSGKVHPVAALFPMMTDEELNDLGADIKANGLLHAIVLDGSGVLIDGRNRMEGCRRGEVPPTFEPLGTRDAVALILSANVARRHLNKGQQAMAVARAGQLSTQLTSRKAGAAIKASHEYVNRAVTVLEYAPDLADSVLLGATPLNEAYEEARHRKQEAKEREEAARSEQERFERLQMRHPDLAAMVQEERLTMGEALAAVEARKAEERLRTEKEREYTELKTKLLDQALRNLDYGLMGPDELAKSWATLSPDVIGETADFSAGRARRCAETLIRYAELKENQDNG